GRGLETGRGGGRGDGRDREMKRESQEYGRGPTGATSQRQAIPPREARPAGEAANGDSTKRTGARHAVFRERREGRGAVCGTREKGRGVLWASSGEWPESHLIHLPRSGRCRKCMKWTIR